MGNKRSSSWIKLDEFDGDTDCFKGSIAKINDYEFYVATSAETRSPPLSTTAGIYHYIIYNSNKRKLSLCFPYPDWLKNEYEWTNVFAVYCKHRGLIYLFFGPISFFPVGNHGLYI